MKVRTDNNPSGEFSKTKFLLFLSLSQECLKDKPACRQGRAFEVLKINEFTPVNVCFQDESNAVFEVFLQRLANRKL